VTASTAVPGRHDIEAVLARHIVARSVYVGPPLIALFWVTSGWDGALASAIGLGIVVVNFLVTGWALSIAARHSLAVYHAAALFGFFLRLGLITLAMVVAVSLVELDRLALGLTAVVSYMALLTWEAVAMVNGDKKELEWS